MNQNYPQQQQQLPFNPQAPQQQFLNLQLGNAPYVPNIQVNPELMQQLPFVCSAAAMNIQQSAQMNPLRMFMFNQCSQNGFQNACFNDLTIFIANYIILRMRRNEFNNLMQCIEVTVPESVSLYAALNLNLYPALGNVVDRNVYNAAIQNFGFFQQVSNEINQMLNGGNQPLNSYQNPGATQNYNNIQPPAHNYGNNTPINRTGTIGNSGLFQSGGSVSNSGGKAPGSGRAMGTKYDHAHPSVVKQPFTARELPTVVEPVAKQVFANVPKDNMFMQERVSHEDTKWVPSKTFPYFHAFNPTLWTLSYTVLADGSLAPFYEKKTIDMNYEQHGYSTNFGPSRTNVDVYPLVKEMEKLNDAVNLINGDTVLMSTDELQTAQIVYKETAIVEVAMSTAIEMGYVSIAESNPGNTPYVYRADAYVGSPYISTALDTELLRNFKLSSSFLELREKMRGCRDEMTQILWHACNQMITKEINRIIRQGLSIEDLYITDFVGDYDALVGDTVETDENGSEIVTRVLAKDIVPILLSDEKRIIRTIFQTYTDEINDDIKAFMLRNLKDGFVGEINFNILASKNTLTYIDACSFDLQLEITPDLPSLLSENLTPELYSLASGIFRDIDESEHLYNRHLIICNDLCILEITRGYFGDDAFLISKVVN
jgi:hypothetical protein